MFRVWISKTSKAIESTCWAAARCSWRTGAPVVDPSSTYLCWSATSLASRCASISTVSKRISHSGAQRVTHAFWSMRTRLKSLSIMKSFGTPMRAWRRSFSRTRQQVTMPFQNSIGLMNHGFNQECFIKNVSKRVVIPCLKTSGTMWTMERTHIYIYIYIFQNINRESSKSLAPFTAQIIRVFICFWGKGHKEHGALGISTSTWLRPRGPLEERSWRFWRLKTLQAIGWCLSRRNYQVIIQSPSSGHPPSMQGLTRLVILRRRSFHHEPHMAVDWNELLVCCIVNGSIST